MSKPEGRESREVQVRAARPDDMPRVAQLAARLIRFHHSLDPDRFFTVEPLEPGYERFLRSELDDREAVVLVAERGQGEIVGYAYGRLEPRNWMDLLDACGKLHDVLVDEGARGEGAGEALVTAMVDKLEAMGAPRVVLSTAHKNERAQRLFERVGFRKTMIEMTREAGGKKARLKRGASGPSFRDTRPTQELHRKYDAIFARRPCRAAGRASTFRQKPASPWGPDEQHRSPARPPGRRGFSPEWFLGESLHPPAPRAGHARRPERRGASRGR